VACRRIGAQIVCLCVQPSREWWAHHFASRRHHPFANRAHFAACNDTAPSRCRPGRAGPMGSQRGDRPRVPGRLQRHLIGWARPAANWRTPSGVVANVPARLTVPPCQIATCAKSRWTSSPIHRLAAVIAVLPSTVLLPIASGWAKRHLRIRARSATWQVAGTATY